LLLWVCTVCRDNIYHAIMDSLVDAFESKLIFLN